MNAMNKLEGSNLPEKRLSNSSNKTNMTNKTQQTLLTDTRWKAKYIIVPFGTFRITWDLIGGLLIIYCTLVVPLQLCLFPDEHIPVIAALDWIMLVFFSLDIPINFNTSHFSAVTGALVSSHYLIAKRYVTSWFVIDVASTVPWEFLSSGSDEDAKSARLIRVLRIVKVLRVLRMLKILKMKDMVQRIFGSVSLRMRSLGQVIMLLSLVCILAHWTSCIWCGICIWAQDGDGWRVKGVPGKELNHGRRYGLAFYHSVLSLTTGPSDYLEFDSDLCLWMQGLSCMLNVCVMCTIVGLLSNVVMEYNNRDGELTAKTMGMASFMREKGVDKNTQYQVLSYIRRAALHAEAEEDLQSLQTLSPVLQRKVAYYMTKEPLSKCVLFNWLGETFIRELSVRASTHLHGPDELLVQQRHCVFGLLCLVKGECRIFKVSQERMQRNGTMTWVNDSGLRAEDIVDGTDELLQSGEYYKDSIWALLKTVHVSELTLMTVSFCETLVIQREAFDDALKSNPGWLKSIEQLRGLQNSNLSQLEEALDKGDMKMLSDLAKSSRLNHGDRTPSWKVKLRSAVEVIKLSSQQRQKKKRAYEMMVIANANRDMLSEPHSEFDPGQAFDMIDMKGFRLAKKSSTDMVMLGGMKKLDQDMKQEQNTILHRIAIMEHRLGQHSPGVPGQSPQPAVCALCRAEYGEEIESLPGGPKSSLGTPHGTPSSTLSKSPCSREMMPSFALPPEKHPAGKSSL